jgi:ATP-dependent RNA helicase DHX8/PRP22
MLEDIEQCDKKSLKKIALQLLEARKELPIWSARKALIRLIAENETVVLVGETGSGKTTQAPQFVLQLLQPTRKIGCTQPRRVAATTIAKRVAAECGCSLGDTVGYSVRFDDCTTDATRIKYVTDGMLIREAIIDPMLRAYSVIFVDEAHERTMNTDVLLGLLKRAQGNRRNSNLELKLVVMSATLDQATFLQFFEGSVPAYIEGRQYPVDIFYTAQPLDSYLQGTLNAIVQV